jgi:hypothetical protein
MAIRMAARTPASFAIPDLRQNAGARVGMEVCCQNGTAQYFRVKTELICIDVRAGRELASCCGVNLAFAGFGRGIFLQTFQLQTVQPLPRGLVILMKWAAWRRRGAISGRTGSVPFSM